MTLIISVDDSIYDNSVTLFGAPSVQITGNRVTFTNKTGGLVSASSNTRPAIELVGTGTLLVNELGARIEAPQAYLNAIVGSSGSDAVDNYGAINGWVMLGDGNDSFIEHRTTAALIAASRVDLGEGDDTFTLYNFPGQNLMPTVFGGNGIDTAILDGSISVIYGSSIYQFEHLVVGAGVANLAQFSGLSSITLTPGGINNFIQSVNPTLDLSLDGNLLGVTGSSAFRDINGSAAGDSITLRSSLGNGAPTVRSIALGGGSDSLTIDVFDAAAVNPVITGTVDGGAGSSDLIQVLTRSTNTVDLANFSGFEILWIGIQFFGAPGTGRVTNANGLLEIRPNPDSDNISLGLSNSPDARISAPFLKSLLLEATTTVGEFGFTPGSTFAPANVLEITQADAQYNLNVINSGTILGSVKLYIGNDTYDGSLGTTGGPIYGYAGDDTLSGGAGAEQIYGGFGSDTLSGGGGIDLLDGGDGFDTADYGASSSGVYVDLYRGLGSGGQAEGDSLISIEAVRGSSFADTLFGTDQDNVLNGNGGSDTINGAGGNDRIEIATPGAVGINNDAATGIRVSGGDGTDTLVVSGSVTLLDLREFEAIELVGGASLTLTAGQFNTGFYNPIVQLGVASVSGTGSLIFNMDANPVASSLFLTTLSFAGGSSVTLTVNGTSGIDAVKGAAAVSNTINGGDGIDQLRGGNQADTLNGGAGDDKLFGWGGADTLTGGSGSDQFRYFFATDSGTGVNADRITDFELALDKFNFVLIDADPVTPDDQAFAFLGTGAFTSPGTGQIRYQDSGTDLLVQVDVDGNGTVDMEMILQGLAGSALTAGNFML